VDKVLLERRGAVVLLTLNRPEALNALDRETLEALERRVAEAAGDSSARALVLTGAGRAFAAGADIEQMRGFTPIEAEDFSRLGHRAFGALEELAIPTIAAVNGYACDWIYASEKARFGQPEVNLGILPGFGGTSRLARRVGLAWAKELVLTGAPIRADVALRIGLANRVFPPEDLKGAALSVGETVAEKGPLAVASAKRVMQEGQGVDPRVANVLEQNAFGLIFGTADRAEGMDAFLEKRDPKFTSK
jgi:enoyl-CoA hydratase